MTDSAKNIISLNKIKTELTLFSQKQLIAEMKKHGIKYAKNLTSKLVKKGFVNKVGVSQYEWASEAPIYIGVIEEIFKEIKKDFLKLKSVSSSEEAAIEFLKSKGYKIMKPVQTFEEV